MQEKQKVKLPPINSFGGNIFSGNAAMLADNYQIEYSDTEIRKTTQDLKKKYDQIQNQKKNLKKKVKPKIPNKNGYTVEDANLKYSDDFESFSEGTDAEFSKVDNKLRKDDSYSKDFDHNNSHTLNNTDKFMFFFNQTWIVGHEFEDHKEAPFDLSEILNKRKETEYLSAEKDESQAYQELRGKGTINISKPVQDTSADIEPAYPSQMLSNFLLNKNLTHNDELNEEIEEEDSLKVHALERKAHTLSFDAKLINNKVLANAKGSPLKHSPTRSGSTLHGRRGLESLKRNTSHIHADQEHSSRKIGRAIRSGSENKSSPTLIRKVDQKTFRNKEVGRSGQMSSDMNLSHENKLPRKPQLPKFERRSVPLKNSPEMLTQRIKILDLLEGQQRHSPGEDSPRKVLEQNSLSPRKLMIYKETNRLRVKPESSSAVKLVGPKLNIKGDHNLSFMPGGLKFKKINSDAYFSEKIEYIFHIRAAITTEFEMLNQNNILKRHIEQIKTALMKLRAKTSLDHPSLASIKAEIKFNKHTIEELSQDYGRLAGLLEKANNAEYLVRLENEIKKTQDLNKKEAREKRNMDFLDRKELLYVPTLGNDFLYDKKTSPGLDITSRVEHYNTEIARIRRQIGKLKEQNIRAEDLETQQASHIQTLKTRYEELSLVANRYGISLLRSKSEDHKDNENKLNESSKKAINVGKMDDRHMKRQEEKVRVLQRDISDESKLINLHMKEIKSRTQELEDIISEIQKVSSGKSPKNTQSNRRFNDAYNGNLVQAYPRNYNLKPKVSSGRLSKSRLSSSDDEKLKSDRSRLSNDRKSNERVQRSLSPRENRGLLIKNTFEEPKDKPEIKIQHVEQVRNNHSESRGSQSLELPRNFKSIIDSKNIQNSSNIPNTLTSTIAHNKIKERKIELTKEDSNSKAEIKDDVSLKLSNPSRRIRPAANDGEGEILEKFSLKQEGQISCFITSNQNVRVQDYASQSNTLIEKSSSGEIINYGSSIAVSNDRKNGFMRETTETSDIKKARMSFFKDNNLDALILEEENKMNQKGLASMKEHKNDQDHRNDIKQIKEENKFQTFETQATEEIDLSYNHKYKVADMKNSQDRDRITRLRKGDIKSNVITYIGSDVTVVNSSSVAKKNQRNDIEETSDLLFEPKKKEVPTSDSRRWKIN